MDSGRNTKEVVLLLCSKGNSCEAQDTDDPWSKTCGLSNKGVKAKHTTKDICFV